MRGARAAQEEVAQAQAVRLRVLVVWFSMYEGDERTRVRTELLGDPRAVHLWDEHKAIGAHYAGSDERFAESGDVLWDAWLLYGADARWRDSSQSPLAFGRTVVRTREALRQALAALAGH